MARSATPFWDRVDKLGSCWIWTGALDSKGYGIFSVRSASTFSGSSSRRSARVAWELTNGPIPPGLHVDHVCKVRACVNPSHLRLITLAENNRGRRAGPASRRPARRNDRRSFWEKVDKNGPNGCWVWTGKVMASGYGYGAGYGLRTVAHRITWTAIRGPIEDGLVLDHLCKNRLCVNPDHLEPVTNSVNVRRGGNTVKKSCTHGHEFTPENTYSWFDKQGRPHRRCKTCHRQRVLRRYRADRGLPP